MATDTLSRRDSRGQRHVLMGGKSFSIAADTSGLEDFLDALGDAADEAVRPAAQAGAQVLYEAVQINVRSIGRVTGNLGNSIYQAYSPENSRNGLAAEYHISWNHLKAPHGHLLERGWVQRYAVTIAKGGKWVTRVRPEAQGKPRPKRRASQAEKDAYFMPRPGGPVHRQGYFFVTRAEDAMPQAYEAANQELQKRLDQVK